MPLEVEEIMSHLRQVIDPEVGLNIVDMGLVYGVADNEGIVTVTMTLTTPGCPMRSYMENEVSEVLGAVDGINEVCIDIVWDPPWSPEMITPAALQELQGGY